MKKILILIAVLIIITVLYFFLGFYNVSANKKHMKITEMVLHSISESSIKRNAEGIQNPHDINNKDIYENGFMEYDEMCVQCHGWASLEPSNTGKGLNPKPPLFPEEVLNEFTVEEIFWVIKNGVKMTGMPAYGPTHEDETIWAIAIFLDKSRNLSANEYSDLKNKYVGNNDDHHHGN